MEKIFLASGTSVVKEKQNPEDNGKILVVSGGKTKLEACG